MTLHYVTLTDRAVVGLAGKDTRPFLQGLITNDIAKVTAEQAILAVLLTPQGKFLHDFFIAAHSDALLLDTERAAIDALCTRLAKYRLRADVTIAPRPEITVTALLGEEAILACGLLPKPGQVRVDGNVLLFVDPRLPALGVRMLATAENAAQFLTVLGARETNGAAYETLRLRLGIPEGSKDATPERTIALENGYDKLGAVDFSKGCYVGQEVTARSHHLGQLKKYLFLVKSDKPLPPKGTAIMAAGKEIGEMRSSQDRIGFALLRVEELQAARKRGEALQADGVGLAAEIPFWHNL